MVDLDLDPTVTGSRSAQPLERNRSSSLTSAHVSKALQDSSDHGATLIFSRFNISDVGAGVAEELAAVGRNGVEDQNSVKRIALDHNRLAALPTEFALLSRLRYLNLKHNNFAVFPDVLTLIPSLDTLDISYNKIRRLPPEPGQLVNLRVVCLSRNKISRLPPYLTRFSNLEVLQVERNPIEWPPKYITEPPGGLDSSHAMQDWIRTLQRWMDLESREKHDDSGYGDEHISSINSTEDSYSSWKSRLQESHPLIPHTRSYSVDSNLSISSIGDSVPGPQFLPSSQSRPPPLHLGILGTASAEPSPTRSFESYPPTPAKFEFPQDSDVTGPGDVDRQSQHHTRTGSYDLLQSVLRRELSNKNSVDLRVPNFEPALERLSNPHESDLSSAASISRGYRDSLDLSSLQRQQGSSSFTDPNGHFDSPSTREPDHLLPPRAIHPITFERDAYFRRLAALPSPRTLPKTLLCLVESVRSILFAVGEIYRTLERHTAQMFDDKISPILRKLMHSAGADILQLINTLDRFDIVSQKMSPAPAICRAVVESCRDTIATFSRALEVLSRHLKILAGDDAKQSRWSTLELYGAAAEVSIAWQSMLPQFNLIKPLLHAKTFASSHLVWNPGASDTIPGLADTANFHRPSILGGIPIVTVGKVRMARRHAGSFSSKDVEIGRTLPSYDDVPGTFGGIAPGGSLQAPVLRAPKRQMTVPLTTVQSPSPTFPALPTKADLYHNDFLSSAHSRQGSQASLRTSGSYSPSVPSRSFSEFPINPQVQVEKEAIHAVHAAIEIAPVVCDMMEDALGDVINMKTSVRDTIQQARASTTKLLETVQLLESTDTTHIRTLQEDAHAFLKNVVQLSNIVKTHAGLHTAAPALRTNMIKLTSSTEELAILLHVSSFSLSTTPRPYTPTLNVSTSQANSFAIDEKQLGSSLSRSRSAHNSPTFQPPPQPDGSRSALPTQTFHLRIPNAGRPRGKDQRIDFADPG